MNRQIPYRDILRIELEGWCYGIANYPGELHAGLIHRVIEELGPSLRRAIEEKIQIDFIKLASKLARAARYVVDEKELTFSLLCQLPNPNYADEETSQYILGAIETASKSFPNIQSFLELKWKFDDEAMSEYE